MEKLIPEYVDPFRLAEQNLCLDGLVKLVDMQRLRSSLLNPGDNDTVTVSLQFGMDEQKLPYINGHLQANLGLQCQRCLERMNYEIISDFALGIVKSYEEEKALPEQYEPAMVQDGQLALRELIEDELILNLPIIPRHEPEVCKVKLPQADAGWKQDESESPFKVLQSLKHKEK
ncbi:MAG TPA: YceD family protein [Gammaproteobacteria bacterium]|jgi:uncharacterized protein|nr:YceD family protein [Gammaproteobacteria bacterium]